MASPDRRLESELLDARDVDEDEDDSCNGTRTLLSRSFSPNIRTISILLATLNTPIIPCAPAAALAAMRIQQVIVPKRQPKEEAAEELRQL